MRPNHTARPLAALPILLLALTVAAAAADRKPADLVLLGGKIVTVDDRRPLAEALAIRADRIVAVGQSADVRPLIGERTRVIDLKGMLAVPGFIDSHGHFLGLGRSKMVLDLTKAPNFDQIVRLVEEAAKKAPPGSWIVGRGWHQSKWDKKPQPNVDGCPTHQKLSRVTPQNPVLLTHASGHMCIANAEAMRIAGVNRQTPDPRGGRILRDSAGDPIGVFRETAMQPISAARGRSLAKRTPEQRREDLDEAIRLATRECLEKGVTSFHDAGASFATVDHYRELARRGRLGVRLWVMVNQSNAALAQRLAEYRLIGLGNHHLTVRAIKRFVDGALGVHGAWLLQPYDDLPASTGLNTTSLASLRQTARLAIRHDFQLCVHAIGDRANREMLDMFAAVQKEHPQKTELRWRIEHAQHLHPADVPRFARLGVIASMQGIHCTSDAAFVIRRLGRRRAQQGAYVWQDLLGSGTVIANGTDAPVEDVDPIACFHASVTRETPAGGQFFPRQRMTRVQALRSYTLRAAYAAFEEHLKGSLAPGKLADVVVLSKDVMTVPPDEIRRARVEYTILGGKVAYRHGQAPTADAAQ